MRSQKSDPKVSSQFLQVIFLIILALILAVATIGRAHAQTTRVVEITKVNVVGRGGDVNVLMSLQRAFRGEGVLATDQSAAGCPKLHVTGTIDVEVEQRGSDFTIDFNRRRRNDDERNRPYIPPFRSDTRSEAVWVTVTLTVELRDAEDKLPLAFESAQGYARAVIQSDSRTDTGYGRTDQRRDPTERKRQLAQQALDQAAAGVAAKIAAHLGGRQPVGQTPVYSTYAPPAPATTTLQVVPVGGVGQPNTAGWLPCTGRLSQMSGTGNVAGWLRQSRMAPVYINGQLAAYIVRRDTTHQDTYHFLLDPTYNLREGTSYTIDVPSPP